MEFICDKYNLTDYELKVIISVVYHEAGWYYDDAFKVATVIYNRTKSKECIRYIHNLTNLDGESLYAQVIATSYTSEGNKVQQFDGYLPKQAGYDYDSLLAESQAAQDYDLVKLNGLLDCLILLKLGEDYENPTFPLAPVFSKIYFYGDGCRNHFSGPISSSDVVDNYNFPYEEYEIRRNELKKYCKEIWVDGGIRTHEDIQTALYYGADKIIMARPLIRATFDNHFEETVKELLD